MPECPICRRTYDDRFKVFVPPHSEAYDTIECARASARSGAAAKEPFLPVILPTIEVVRPAPVAATGARRAGIGAGAFAPAQLALAGGVGLLAAGTAAAVYMAAKPPSKLDHGTTIAAGAGPTLPARPAVTPPAEQTSGAAGPTLRRVKPHEKSKATIRRPRPAVARVTPTTLTRAPSPAQGSAQLASRIIPSSASSPVSSSPESTTGQQSANAGASPQPKPHRSPPAVHRSPRPKSPKPPTPAAPTPTTTTSTPPTPEPTPTPTAEPEVAASTADVASPVTETAAAAKPRPDKNHGQNPEPPPSPQPPPPSPPPTAGPSQPPGSDESDDDDHGSRPGNGWGDKNHDHTGPPGHDDRGESGSHSSDDEHGNCHGDGHGHGNGHDHDD